MNPPKVAVVGSANVDLVIRTERIPHRGETIFGESFDIFTGGKGFNQATAASRIGADVTFIGRVGDDYFGELIISAMATENINTNYVKIDNETGTGIANILIDPNGENSIIVVPRANMSITTADIDDVETEIANADILLLQLETPLEASFRATEIARANGTTVILDPAPARSLPDEFMAQIDILTPNTSEAATLYGKPIDTTELCIEAAKVLHKKIASGQDSAVVITLANRGVLLHTTNQTKHTQPISVDAVDTTGAGDAFTGALATELASGKSVSDSVHFANAAGAAAVTVLGATPSMPTRSIIESLLSN